ncbi:MAG TPA: tetratricopeptide repeat protein [Planctomycetota bacterium]|nr:tetratricopeptide repeat protein [Planctomycetota bacterium]
MSSGTSGDARGSGAGSRGVLTPGGRTGLLAGSPSYLSQQAVGAGGRGVLTSRSRLSGALAQGGTATGRSSLFRRSSAASSFSATVPSLHAASSLSSRRFHSGSSSLVQRHVFHDHVFRNRFHADGFFGHRGHHFGHHGHHHRHSSFFGFFGFPFGFSLGVSFGYPYSYYPYYSHAYWGGYPYVSYPYVGYYYQYPYAYLPPSYDCDFYDGYYVRFGPYRSSYYASCSGYGHHGHAGHHCHTYACSTHGHHEYHVRDCSLCYPGGSYVYQDVDVPDVPVSDVSAPAEAALPVTPTEDLSEDASPAVRPLAEVDAAPATREEAFFASLRPAQLSFAMGMVSFQKGSYEEAAEAFYNASLEDPESRLVKVFLGTALFAVGEYHYSAEYLRLGLDDWSAFPSYRWNLRALYQNQEDFAAQTALLEEEVQLHPGNEDALLVLAFVKQSAGDLAGAGAAVDALRALSPDPVDGQIASDFARAAETRSGVAAESDAGIAPAAGVDDAPAVRAFLTSLSLADIPALPMR